MSDALTAKLRALSDPRACQDNEFGASAACAEALAEVRALRARVAALEAVERAARSEIAYMDETKAAHPDAVVEPTLNELRAALAALEVNRG